MYLPEINKRRIEKHRTDRFKGINKGRVVAEGEFADSYNLSSGAYPALTSAPVRYELDSYPLSAVATPLFFYNRGIYYAAPLREDMPYAYTLYKDGVALRTFKFDQSASMVNLTAFNSKTLLIKKSTAYEFDPTASSVLTGLFEMGYTLDVSPAHVNTDYSERTLCLSVVYEDKSRVGSFSMGTEDAVFPQKAEVGDMFAKHLEYYRLIYKDANDPAKNIWQPVTSVRVRLEIGDGYRCFKPGDYIRLKDLKYWNWAERYLTSLDRFVRIEYIDDTGGFVTEPIGVFDSMDKLLSPMTYPTNDIGYGDIIINNPGNRLTLLSGNVSACMPSMDFVCTGANRVWGCSNDNREIYASELGNARNFSVFEGLSGDSYAVTVGSEGDFTACCSYLGAPVFFKENEMIVITGSRPASFTLNSYSVKGVPAHSPQGVCVASDILYYISSDGVYAYNGSSSACISYDLGSEVKAMSEALLFGDGNLLYLTAKKKGQWVQYTYDIKNRIWHRQRSERVIGCIRYSDAAIAVCYDAEKISFSTLERGIPRDYELNGARALDYGWYWETGDISYSENKKYLRKLSIDMSCNGDSRLYVSYDGDDFYEIISIPPHDRGSRKISVFPRRCDRFRLRMEGDGEMTLYALTGETEEVASDG